MLPFKEKVIEETETYILVQRNFMSTLDSKELNWHMDKEDRDVCVIEGDGWYLQIVDHLQGKLLRSHIRCASSPNFYGNGIHLYTWNLRNVLTRSGKLSQVILEFPPD